MSVLEDPRALADLVIIEIGNSHVSVAAAVEGQVYSNHRFAIDGSDAIVDAAQSAWDSLSQDRLKAVAVASVVPEVLSNLREPLEERLSTELLVVGEQLHRPLSLAVESPESVGIDRVCSAAAAYDVNKRACVVASFGTAITIDCVNDEGAFLGGAILPGLDLQAWALQQRTAQLPLVKMESPRGVYGGSTEEAIRDGVIYGVVGGLREITERYATELKAWPELVACGGNAEFIARHTDIIDRVVPDLCLRGIALAYRKHYAPFEDDDGEP